MSGARVRSAARSSSVSTTAEATRGATSRPTNANAAPSAGATARERVGTPFVSITGTVCAAGTGNASTIASDGQTATHARQSLHSAASIRATSSTRRIAFDGHTCRHAPQPAQRVSSTCIIRSFLILKCAAHCVSAPHISNTYDLPSRSAMRLLMASSCCLSQSACALSVSVSCCGVGGV